MKKLLISYSVFFETEITDEAFNRAMSKTGVDRGDAFNRAFSIAEPFLWNMLPRDSVITGVYNPSTINNEGEVIFAQDDDPEVYWED